MSKRVIKTWNLIDIVFRWLAAGFDGMLDSVFRFVNKFHVSSNTLFCFNCADPLPSFSIKSTPSYQNEISNFPVATTVRTGITCRLSHRQNLPSSTAVSASVRSIHNSGSDENKRHNPLSHNYTQSATDSMKKIMRRQQRQLQKAKSASAQKQHQAPQTSIFDDHFESALLRGSSNETDYALSSRVLSCNTPTANRMNASRTSRWYSTPKSASNILHGFENFEPTSLSSCKGGEGKRKRSSTNSKSRLQSPSETFSFGKRSISANSTELRGR